MSSFSYSGGCWKEIVEKFQNKLKNSKLKKCLIKIKEKSLKFKIIRNILKNFKKRKI